MKLAFSSISALDRPLASAAKLAAEAGLDGLELTERAPHLAPGCDLEAAAAAGRAVRAAGLEVVAFGSYLGREAPAEPEAAAHAAAFAVSGRKRTCRPWSRCGRVGRSGGRAVGRGALPRNV